jgi:hypothetical protein
MDLIRYTAIFSVDIYDNYIYTNGLGKRILHGNSFRKKENRLPKAYLIVTKKTYNELDPNKNNKSIRGIRVGNDYHDIELNKKWKELKDKKGHPKFKDIKRTYKNLDRIHEKDIKDHRSYGGNKGRIIKKKDMYPNLY